MKQNQRDYYRRLAKIKHHSKLLREIAIELETYEYEVITDIKEKLLKLAKETYENSKRKKEKLENETK